MINSINLYYLILLKDQYAKKNVQARTSKKNNKNDYKGLASTITQKRKPPQSSEIINQLFIAIQIQLVSDFLRMPNYTAIIFKTDKMMQRKPWKAQEDQVLTELVKTIGDTNWTLVSIRLAQQCPGLLKTGKQCRQRWFNHLDDKVVKNPWEEMEQKVVFDLHAIHGNKWKEITKHLKNRTQNDVKNHFYAQLRKGIRRINKFLGFPKNPSVIRSIRPCVLSDICEEQNKLQPFSTNGKQNPDLQNGNAQINNLIFKFSKNEPTEKQAQILMANQRLVSAFEKLLSKIIQRNEQYLKKKQVKNQEKVKRRSVDLTKQNTQKFKDFDISEYLCLDYEPSPVIKSQGYEINSSIDSIDISLSPRSQSNILPQKIFKK